MTDSEVTGHAIRPGGFASAPEEYGDLSISEIVREWARQLPGEPAFVTAGRTTTWREYDDSAEAIAAELREGAGARVALVVPDTAIVHAALCGCYRAGRIATAIGVRSGAREIAHIMGRAGARTLITVASIRGRSWRERHSPPRTSRS
ncbi:AMP-binding protein [Nocardia albiluteola]|uniref:AMP-binding protein n=1 Tax=Nocardia albiluteola TaxID=2842303 RepID=UPI001FD9F1B7|nr:AMP-binding protein [Nocardia albiluteola]